MSLVKRLAVLALALALVLGLYGLARAQNVKPLSEADLTKLIELQVGDDAVTAWMERSGVAFPIDAAVRARAREQAEREAEAKRLALLEEQERCKAEEEERARRREAEEQADLPPRVKALIEALQDKDPEVREAAALSLAKMGAKAQGVVSALEQALLGATKAKDPEVRRWATKWLGKLDEGKPRGSRR